MKPMARPTTDRRFETETHSTNADADVDERDIPHFRSLILPDLVSADALIPEWLRRLFRRTDTHAA
jgi:hypothetical protein